MMTDLCLLAIAGGLFCVAAQLRALRLGHTSPDAAENWTRAVARHVAQVRADADRRRRAAMRPDY